MTLTMRVILPENDTLNYPTNFSHKTPIAEVLSFLILHTQWLRRKLQSQTACPSALHTLQQVICLLVPWFLLPKMEIAQAASRTGSLQELTDDAHKAFTLTSDTGNMYALTKC